MDSFLYDNEKSRCRTIKYILKKSIMMLKKKNHQCKYDYCYPRNILKFLTQEEAIFYSYDIDIFICNYQQIHICDNTCLGNIFDKEGFKICGKTNRKKQQMYNYIELTHCTSSSGISSTLPSVPQDIKVVEGHRSTIKTNIFNLKLDNYYNDYPKTKKKTVNKMSTPVTPKHIKKRSKKVNKKEHKKRDKIPSNNELLDIFLMKQPINYISNNYPINLMSYKLYNFTKKKLIDKNGNPTKMFKLSTGELKYYDVLKKREKEVRPYTLKFNTIFNSTHLDIINTAEQIFPKIFPSIFRIKENYFVMQSIQNKLYTECINYIDKCINEKKIANRFKINEILSFDNDWKDRHELTNWISEKQWNYYLQIILRSYKFCEMCGEKKQKRKCLGPIKHVLGVMYTLKEGYNKKIKINCFEVNYTIIPQDLYLNKYGVMLEKNKLSTYFGKEARKLGKFGQEMFQEFLDFGTKLMSPLKLRNIIFPDI